jgi:uncharacterized protein YcfL
MYKFTALILSTGLLAGCATHKVETKADGTTETVIKMEEVPQNVMFQFQKDYPRVTPTKIEKEVYRDGTVHYEFSWKDAGGKETETEYNTAGEQLRGE